MPGRAQPEGAMSGADEAAPWADAREGAARGSHVGCGRSCALGGCPGGRSPREPCRVRTKLRPGRMPGRAQPEGAMSSCMECGYDWETPPDRLADQLRVIP